MNKPGFPSESDYVGVMRACFLVQMIGKYWLVAYWIPLGDGGTRQLLYYYIYEYRKGVIFMFKIKKIGCHFLVLLLPESFTLPSAVYCFLRCLLLVVVRCL